MRSRLSLLFAPAILAGSMFLTASTPARAADGMTETGNTTYEVVPGKNIISVIVSLSIYNGTPNTANYTYSWNATQIAVENEAGPVSVTSNAGPVSQSQVKTDKYYRYLALNYPPVYYGQTRVVTATYAIPAAPHAKGGFRAVAAYAGLCVSGNGNDTGTVSVVIPDGFELYVESGGELTKTADSDGKQVYSSGTQSAPNKFRACVDAENPSNLTHSSMTVGSGVFDIGAWPEDPTWAATVRDRLGDDVGRLEDLTGLSMPGGTVEIMEVGDWNLGEYGGAYDATTATAYIPETVLPDTIARQLSRIWFNGRTFADRWASEGLARYSERVAGEGNYTPCSDPGPYPGSGSPDLSTWLTPDNDAPTQEEAVSTYQHAASCYIITTLVETMGPEGFKAVMRAAAGNEMAYIGATPGEKANGASLALSAKEVLDLVDERGMLPAGITDLDRAQTLLSTFGIFNSTTLAGRSQARSTYHALLTAAKSWKLPLAVRAPMARWDFATAQTAMATVTEILGVRDATEKALSGFSLDGTPIQHAFEGAAGQTDLDSLLALIRKEADAAGVVDRATKLRDSNGFLETIGLLGTDIETPLKQAKADLADAEPDPAGAQAQSVIDQLKGSRVLGILRLGILLTLLVAIAFLMVLYLFIRRPRSTVAVPVADSPPIEPTSSLTPGQATDQSAGSPDARLVGPSDQPATPWPTLSRDLGLPAATATPWPTLSRDLGLPPPTSIPPEGERRRGEPRTPVPPERERRRAGLRTPVPPEVAEPPIVEETPAAVPHERRRGERRKSVPPTEAEAVRHERRRGERRKGATDGSAGPAPGE